MKFILALLIMHLAVSGANGQAHYTSFQYSLVNTSPGNVHPMYGDSGARKLDSNTEYRNVRDGVVMQGGQLKLVRNGFLYPMAGPVTLKNGSIVMTDGIIRMTNGSTPSLNEADFIDMDGNIKPLQKTLNDSYSKFVDSISSKSY
jgi:hypothetical protein